MSATVPSTPPQRGSLSAGSPFNTTPLSHPSNGTVPPLTLQSLPQLERLAALVYTTADNAERHHASEMLAPFSANIAYLPQCRFVLETSNNEYALVFAASALLKLVTRFFHSFSATEGVEVKNFLLNYLATKYAAPNFVLNPVIQTIVRLVKLGWRVDSGFSEILVDVQKFLLATPRHHRLGLSLMQELVHEMNENRTSEAQSEHRKTARAFRDSSLLSIFQLAMQSIRQVAANSSGAATDKEFDDLIGSALALCIQVLAFDFIGSALDESQDDLTSITIQLPAAWKSTVEDLGTTQLFYDALAVLTPQRQSQALDILSSLASMRKSIFSAEEKRLAFLNVMIRGVQSILTQHANILSDSDVFHSFCILLARIKSNYALPELAKLEGYETFIQIIANFTLTALASRSSSPHSLHYLLVVWARVVAELPHLKIEVSPFLNDFLPELSMAWLSARLDAIVVAAKDDSTDELFAEPTLSDQLRQLPSLCRYNYDRTRTFLKSRIDGLIADYTQLTQAVSQQGPSAPTSQWERLTTLEYQLALMIYIWSAVIASDSSVLSSGLGWEPESSFVADKDRAESIDAELCAWYFQTMPIIEFRLSLPASVSHPVPGAVAQASLQFLQEFRKRFLGHIMRMPTEQKAGEEGGGENVSMTGMDSGTMGGGQVVLMPLTGFDDSSTASLVYPLIPFFGGHSPFIPLLSAIASDGEAYMSGSSRGSSFFARLNAAYKSMASAPQQQQQLAKHAITQTSVIANMLSTCLLFLNCFANDEATVQSALELLDSLSLGYASSQLLSQSEPIKNILSNHRFDAFPFLARAGQRKARLHASFYLILGRVLFKSSNLDHFDAFMAPFNQAFAALGAMQNLRNEQSAQATIALCSKLQGLLEACQSYVTYSLLFDWLYPQQLPVLLRLAETFADHDRVSAACLRFYSELVFNRSQRIRFDAQSPNGVILFKEAAKLVTAHTHRLLNFKPETATELYKLKIKGVSLILGLINRALNGQFANFGLMSYYEDKTLTTAFTLILRLILSLSLSDLLVYPALAEPYFAFMETMFKSHLSVMLEVDNDAFLTLVHSMQEGLGSFSLACSTHAANALDSLISSVCEIQARATKLAQLTPPVALPPALAAQSKHLARHLPALTPVCHDIFLTLLSIYLFDHPSNQFTLSRPIFALLCFEPGCWAELTQRMLAAQPNESRTRIAALLSDCTNGIQFNLELEERERFYSNLNKLKQELAGLAVRFA